MTSMGKDSAKAASDRASPNAPRIFAAAEGEGTFGVANWQMTFGERAALIGFVMETEPKLAIEIGSAFGGSLKIIASTSAEVHSFDLVLPPQRERFRNVTFHTGDSHVLLPQLLSDLSSAGRNVDFVLVDGDHSAEGVFLDVTQLLSSECIRRTVMLLHDPENPDVRDGLNRVDWQAYPKVRHVDLEAVPGRLCRSGPFAGQVWGGLGLVLVDADAPINADSPVQTTWFDTLPMILAFPELEHVLTSTSWRFTAPFRSAGALVRRVLHLKGISVIP